MARLPSEDLKEPVRVLSDGRPPLHLPLSTREDHNMHVLLTLGGLEQDVHEIIVPFLHLRPFLRIEAQLPFDEDIEDLVVGTLRIVVEDSQHVVIV